MSAMAATGPRAALAPVLLAALATLCVATAHAQQPDGFWDHFKTYSFAPAIPAPPGLPPVTLRDEFGEETVPVLSYTTFMNPVRKSHGLDVYPIHDAGTHYTWWLLPSRPASQTVSVNNQFGSQTLVLHEAIYLLNPALLNQTGPPPIRNHYKCYTCQGSAVNAPIGMLDSFDSWGATVLRPLYFCNPVEKQVGPEGGPTYPVVEPNQRYVCYEFDPMDLNQFTAVVSDQFLRDQATLLVSARMICVPTFMVGVTSTGRDTWGSLKLLYR
jgi:hypothetical protein